MNLEQEWTSCGYLMITPLWKHMHLQPVFEKAHYYGGNIAEKLFENGLCLPSGSNLAQSEKEKVLAIIEKELIMKKN
jgi:dTDP-4-amino-4,6-dideoxygalactose transaminase